MIGHPKAVSVRISHESNKSYSTITHVDFVNSQRQALEHYVLADVPDGTSERA